MLGVNGVFSSVTCFAFSRMAAKIDKFMIMIAGFALVGICYFLFALPASYIQIIVSSVFLGLGTGMSTTAAVNVLSEYTTPNTSGKIMGGYSAFLYLGQFSSVFIVAALIAFVCDTQSMFIAIGILALILATAYLPVRVLAGKAE